MATGHEQARIQMQKITQMVAALNAAQADARARIRESAIAVEIRGAAEEFRILLCVGGPHVEIRGELDRQKEPVLCSLWHSNPCTMVRSTGADFNVLQTYCEQFSFN